jgi:hypothetical protein
VTNAWKVVPFLCLLLGCTPRPHPTPAPSPSPTVEPTPAPTETPVPSLCPNPVPVLAEWRLHPVGRWTDATPLVHGCAYCAEIGLGTMPGSEIPRCDCPVRPEGHPDRVACEVEATRGPAWSCPLGGTLVLREGNPLQARCDGGLVVRVCDGRGAVCAEAGQ